MSHPTPDRAAASAAAAVAEAAARVRAALPLPAGRCLLRPVRGDDAAALQAYRGLEEVTRYLGHPPLDRAGMERTLAGWLADDATVSVVAQLDGRVVGDVRMALVPSRAMSPARTTAVEGRIGYAFHPEVHGRGLATGCVRHVVALAVERAGARRVTARVFAPARASSRLLGRLGFARDGVDRATVLAPDGSSWWDDELWSLLREEWPPATAP